MRSFFVTGCCIYVLLYVYANKTEDKEMKLTRINNDTMHIGTAYYVITCADADQAGAMEFALDQFGWDLCSDGLEDNEVGIFLKSGIYGEEKSFKVDYKAAKKNVL